MTTTTGEIKEITAGDKAYFQRRQKNRAYEAVFKRFTQLAGDDELTRAQIARRLKKRPEQITRLLSGPGNWELDTISDLLLAMDAELDFRVAPLDERPTPNYAHPLCAVQSNQGQSEAQQTGLAEASQAANQA
jgi:hypothetical protein